MLLRWAARILVVAAAAAIAPVSASELSPTTRGRIAGNQATLVIVEIDSTATDRSAQIERARRHLRRDDPSILGLRSRGYDAIKSRVKSDVAGPDAIQVITYSHFPLSVWRVSSLAALNRLEKHPAVRTVHENRLFRPVSVSDLPFISQPQTAAQGAVGAGTTVAVIDGGLGSNYLNYPDFGSCTGVNTPPATCRVVYNQDFYPGASTQTAHGTNVSAIALGVAPGAKLAMFDVFNGSTASGADVLTAMNSAISFQETYNVVAINMSLGDNSIHSTQCTGSVFAPAVANAANAGIVTVVAAGNNGSKAGLAEPACAPAVVSVGAVYDGSYGTLTWNAAAAPGGQCTDASAADHVTCFSQSASYLSLLAPGTFVSAPSSSFQQSGTSQATPHVSGSIAVLRARYPTESLSQTLQRLQITGVTDTDSGNGSIFPRLNLFAATNQGTALSLSGTGPATATQGGTSNYTLTASNSGPLAATHVVVSNTLPSGAIFMSASASCVFASGIVTCSTASLGASANITFTITVGWSVSGPVYDTASIAADQINSAPVSQQTIAFGVAPGSGGGDAPLPLWMYIALGIGLAGILWVHDSRRGRARLWAGRRPTARGCRKTAAMP